MIPSSQVTALENQMIPSSQVTALENQVDSQLMPFENQVDSQVMPFDSQVMPIDSQVMPSDSEVMPSDSQVVHADLDESDVELVLQSDQCTDCFELKHECGCALQHDLLHQIEMIRSKISTMTYA
jgi:hypothetical protein